MATQEAIEKVVSACKAMRLANAPKTEEDLLGYARGLHWALSGVDDARLSRGLKAHFQDPERGRWWPAPADLLRGAQEEVNPHGLPGDVVQAILEYTGAPGELEALGALVDESFGLKPARALPACAPEGLLGQAPEGARKFLKLLDAPDPHQAERDRCEGQALVAVGGGE